MPITIDYGLQALGPAGRMAANAGFGQFQQNLGAFQQTERMQKRSLISQRLGQLTGIAAGQQSQGASIAASERAQVNSNQQAGYQRAASVQAQQAGQAGQNARMQAQIDQQNVAREDTQAHQLSPEYGQAYLQRAQGQQDIRDNSREHSDFARGVATRAGQLQGDAAQQWQDEMQKYRAVRNPSSPKSKQIPGAERIRMERGHRQKLRQIVTEGIPKPDPAKAAKDLAQRYADIYTGGDIAKVGSTYGILTQDEKGKISAIAPKSGGAKEMTPQQIETQKAEDTRKQQGVMRSDYNDQMSNRRDISKRRADSVADELKAYKSRNSDAFDTNPEKAMKGFDQAGAEQRAAESNPMGAMPDMPQFMREDANLGGRGVAQGLGIAGGLLVGSEQPAPGSTEAAGPEGPNLDHVTDPTLTKPAKALAAIRETKRAAVQHLDPDTKEGVKGLEQHQLKVTKSQQSDRERFSPKYGYAKLYKEIAADPQLNSELGEFRGMLKNLEHYSKEAQKYARLPVAQKGKEKFGDTENTKLLLETLSKPIKFRGQTYRLRGLLKKIEGIMLKRETEAARM